MRSQFAVLFHMFLMLFYLGKDIIFFVVIFRGLQVRIFFIFFVRKLCVQVGNGAQVKIPRQCDLSGRAIVILTTRSEKAGIGEELHFQAFNRHVSTTKPLLLRKKLIFRGQ